MKKIVCLLLCLCTFVSLFAEINPSRRKVEFGLGVNPGISNNYLLLGDIFKEEIVFDFNDISRSMGYKGLRFDINAGIDTFFKINLKKIKLDFFVNVEGGGFLNFSKSVIDFIAKGNKFDETFIGTAGVGGSVYANIGMGFGTTVRKHIIKITPIYFMPVIYIPNTSATVTVVTKSSGAIKAEAEINLAVHSPFSLNDGMNNFDAASLFGCGGMDITMEAEYPLMSFLDLGIKMTGFPLVPARLNYVMKQKITEKFEVDDSGIIGLATQEPPEGENTTYGEFEVSDFEFSQNENLKIYRPFKISFLAAYRPLKSDLLVLKPVVAFKFNDPSSQFTGMFLTKGFDLEFGMKVESWLLKMIGLGLNMYREDAVWKQQLMMILDLRVFELDLFVGMESSNFLQSFAGRGLNVGLFLKFGF